MKEKAKWASSAAQAYKETTNCKKEEQKGFEVGWLLGFGATKGRLDVKLDYLQRMLFQHKSFSAVDLVKDIREQFAAYGEKEVE